MNRKRREEEEEELLKDALNRQREFDKAVLEQSLVDAAKETQKQRTVASVTQDVEQNMGQVEKAIRSDQDIPADIKDNLIIATTNPLEVQKAAKRNLNTRDAQQSDNSIKNQFLDALTFFGPQIIGGLFGAAEGDAGMIAGAEMGGKLRDQYLDYNFKRQDKELARQKTMAQDPTKQIISQPFRIKDGSGWAFPRKTIDPASGQPIVKFFREDGTEVASRMVEEPQDTRTKAYLPFKKKQVSQADVKIMESAAQNFIRKGTPVEREVSQLSEIRRIKDLIDSNAPFKGLLESAMAKGLGGEVGNLAVEERKAAAQIVGFKGKLADFEEFVTSEISSLRKQEIKKLLEFMEPKLKQRLSERASRYAKTRAKAFSMDQEYLKNYLLETTGIGFEEDEPELNNRRQQLIDKIKRIRAGRRK